MNFKRLEKPAGTYLVWDSFPDMSKRNEIKDDDGNITSVEYGATITNYGTVYKMRHQSPRTNAIGTRWFASCGCHDYGADGAYHYQSGGHPAHGFTTRAEAGKALEKHYAETRNARRSA